jgi:type I restriction enzyme S subunit
MELKPGYKQTEVGVIPDDWDAVPLGKLYKFSNGVNADKAAYRKGLRFINVLEPITYSHIRGPEIPGLVELTSQVASAYTVNHGDIVFNRTSETDTELGMAAVYLGHEKVVFGGFVIRGQAISHCLDTFMRATHFAERWCAPKSFRWGKGPCARILDRKAFERFLCLCRQKMSSA